MYKGTVCGLPSGNLRWWNPAVFWYGRGKEKSEGTAGRKDTGQHCQTGKQASSGILYQFICNGSQCFISQPRGRGIPDPASGICTEKRSKGSSRWKGMGRKSGSPFNCYLSDAGNERTGCDGINR